MKNMKRTVYFDDYSIQDNEGFKITFGNLVVSVCCHNYLGAYSKMDDNGIKVDFNKFPREIGLFTFNEYNTEVAVFDKETGDFLTDKFVDCAGDDVANGVSPSELIDILVKVRDYSKNKSGD